VHPTSDDYDAVIVGARVAGAATAMLLAERGWRVLVVDRTAPGTDTVSTHALTRAGVLQLQRWGLLDLVVRAGTPPIREMAFHYDDGVVPVSVKPAAGVDALYAPRRTVLDPILAAAARDAGAELRFGTTVRAVERDRAGRVAGVAGHDAGGDEFVARAPLTIGADGLRSSVARFVDAPVQRVGRHASAFVYRYFRGIGGDRIDWHFRPHASAGVIPTNDGAQCVFLGAAPERMAQALRADGAAGFGRLLAEAAPELAEALPAAEPVSGFRRFGGAPGVVRRPHGPGWALVGDAGLFRDPLSSHGITDALRDAELLARAADAGDLSSYAAIRDELALALFDVVDEVASYGWTTSEVRALLLAMNEATRAEVGYLDALDRREPGLAGAA
jgi:flavin-dependent dehydrogenase